MKICTQQARLFKNNMDCRKCPCIQERCPGKLIAIDDDSTLPQVLTAMQSDRNKFFLPN